MRNFWTITTLCISTVIGVVVRIFPAPAVQYSPTVLGQFDQLKFYLHDAVGAVWSWPIVASLCFLGGAFIITVFVARSPKVRATCRVIGIVTWALAWMPFMGVVVAVLSVLMIVRSSASPGRFRYSGSHSLDAMTVNTGDLVNPPNANYRRNIWWAIGLMWAASLLMALFSLNTAQPWILTNNGYGGGRQPWYTVTLAIQLFCLGVFSAAMLESVQVEDRDI